MLNGGNIFNDSTLQSSISLANSTRVQMPYLGGIYYYSVGCLCFWDFSILSPFAKDYGELYSACLKNHKENFLIQDRYLFKGTRLCVPRCGTRELLVREVHGVLLVGHFSENKAVIMLKEYYY